MSRTPRIAVIATATAAVVSTPAVWLLDGPGPGQFVGASVQAATGVAALLWAMLRDRPAPAAHDTVEHTGDAVAVDGGNALTGFSGPADRSTGPSVTRHTGATRAEGAGSVANSGTYYR
ncbi:hypothetical protein [Kitasatospora sp. NBC_01539]|uniref:hypothetical protein n=1 Tax=Kitasatospora sp. NBC_01539 TaxID=2903577 RepID=UPI00386025CB